MDFYSIIQGNATAECLWGRRPPRRRCRCGAAPTEPARVAGPEGYASCIWEQPVEAGPRRQLLAPSRQPGGH